MTTLRATPDNRLPPSRPKPRPAALPTVAPTTVDATLRQLVDVVIGVAELLITDELYAVIQLITSAIDHIHLIIVSHLPTITVLTKL